MTIAPTAQHTAHQLAQVLVLDHLNQAVVLVVQVLAVDQVRVQGVHHVVLDAHLGVRHLAEAIALVSAQAVAVQNVGIDAMAVAMETASFHVEDLVMVIVRHNVSLIVLDTHMPLLVLVHVLELVALVAIKLVKTIAILEPKTTSINNIQLIKKNK